jgi:ankyrin repeat protein
MALPPPPPPDAADAGALWRALECAPDAAAFDDAFAALAESSAAPSAMTARTLALAVRAGAPAAVRLLLTHGRVRPHDGLLTAAVRLPDAAAAAALAAALVRLGGLDVNAAGAADGWTPLHEAVAHGAGGGVVTALLQLGADPRAVSADGATPAVAAARANNAPALRALAAAGVPVLGGGRGAHAGGTLSDDGGDGDGGGEDGAPSPLTAALEALAGSAVRALLRLMPPAPPLPSQHPLLRPVVRGGRLPALHWLVDQPAPLRFALAPADAAELAAEKAEAAASSSSARRLDGSTSSASLYGADSGGAPTLSGPCSPSASSLPAAAASAAPERPSPWGWRSSPHAAVTTTTTGGGAKLLPPRPPPSPLDAAPPPSVLLLDGFDLDAADGGDASDAGNDDDAATASHVDVLAWLLGAGAAPDVRDARQRTPLHAACARLDAPAAAALLAAGADAGARDAAGAAPHEGVPSAAAAAAAAATAAFLRAYASCLDAAGWAARSPHLCAAVGRALAEADAVAAAVSSAAAVSPPSPPPLVGRPGLSALAVAAGGGGQ